MDESLARIPVKIQIIGIVELEGELNRLTAPLTVKEVVKRLPINGRVHSIRSGVSMMLGLKKGAEKPVRNVEAGTMVYWPRGDALQIYYAEMRPRGPVNKIGAVYGELNLLKDLKLGSRMIIERA